ncbi:MAG: NAD(P)H-hydrate dehydratase [Bacteroidota bacterium]|nr:NAD(P)H-hydrate dehydratase [Bacteroidota bacterium]
MKLILTPEQMKSVDEYAIKKSHIPSLRLMENAGKAVVEEILDRLNPSTSSDKKRRNFRQENVGQVLKMTNVVVFCGKGNNGGDGFVVARLLSEKGMNVTVVLIESEKELSGDGAVNYQRLQDGKITRLQILEFGKFLILKNKKFDIVVDAMLGTSFRGELKGKYSKAVEWCNKQSSLKIAIDIPTGLNGETGEVLSNTFQADATVTMSNPKIGFYREGAKEFTGEVVVADIGISKKVFRYFKKQNHTNIMLVEESDVQKTFPKRASNSHKHSVGKIFVIAGSKGMMGAALLCSQSAMRTGAGQVILGIPDSEYATIAKRTIEVMPLGLPVTNEGSLSSKALDGIEKRIDWSNVVLLGCGLSGNDETQQLIREIIKKSDKPMVIDADGLNALVGNLDLLIKRNSKNIVLTPHRGEFSRLIGISSKEIERNKYSFAANFAQEYNLILVLKGAPTITAIPCGKIFVNPTGNSGMSTAGSGDVLAGIIASLIGQGNSVSDAAINGVFVHGRAGDFTAGKVGMHGMIASDMIKNLPFAITSIIGK